MYMDGGIEPMTSPHRGQRALYLWSTSELMALVQHQIAVDIFRRFIFRKLAAAAQVGHYEHLWLERVGVLF